MCYFISPHLRLFKSSLTKQFKIDFNGIGTLRFLHRAPLQVFETLGSKSASNLISCQYIRYYPTPEHKDKTSKESHSFTTELLWEMLFEIERVHT